jgi:hypothetical protein
MLRDRTCSPPCVLHVHLCAPFSCSHRECGESALGVSRRKQCRVPAESALHREASAHQPLYVASVPFPLHLTLFACCLGLPLSLSLSLSRPHSASLASCLPLWVAVIRCVWPGLPVIAVYLAISHLRPCPPRALRTFLQTWLSSATTVARRRMPSCSAARQGDGAWRPTSTRVRWISSLVPLGGRRSHPFSHPGARFVSPTHDSPQARHLPPLCPGCCPRVSWPQFSPPGAYLCLSLSLSLSISCASSSRCFALAPSSTS